MAYVLVLVGVLLGAAGYLLGVRRGRSREDALKAAIDERNDKLTLVENELLRRSSVEPATGLPTQQYFQDFLEREWRRASRERNYVSLLMIEIDHFVAYHERLGKPEGDACLRAVADVLKPLIHRPGDALARYGAPGKFGIVLGGTDGKGAMVLAERVRAAIDQLQKPHPASTNSSTVTASIGVAAMMPDREGTWQDIELIAAAEKALAHAKEAGRNRVSLEQTAVGAKSG